MVKPHKKKYFLMFIILNIIILTGTLLPLYYADELAAAIDVIGIRISVLVVAFAQFMSSASFSLLVYIHNRTVSRANEDANKRGELFRNLQFTSSNYSIIEFMDRMLIYNESSRYIDKFIKKRDAAFHMFEEGINEDDVFNRPDSYNYISVKIPFKIVEGKLVSKIQIEKLKFERETHNFEFISSKLEDKTRAYILYNEYTKRNNVIINLVVRKESDFFNPKAINVFSKIKISINITSLLGVTAKGTSELYFINPEQIEGDGTNTYKINSSNFVLKGMPFLDEEAEDII